MKKKDPPSPEILITVPTKIQERLEKCLQEVEKIHQDILIRQRTDIVLPLTAINEEYLPVTFFPNHAQALQNVLQKKVISLKDVTPSFIQYSSFTLTHVHQYPELFAKSVFNHFNQNDKFFLLYSVIPSMYGWFSSKEHTELALKFYLNLIQVVDKNKLISLDDKLCDNLGFFLRPFLTSFLSFRFIENTMKMFSIVFISYKKLSPSYLNRLKTAILRYLELLPKEIISIFKELAKLKKARLESKKNLLFASIFFNHFFIPASLSWMKASPFFQYSNDYKILAEKLKETKSIGFKDIIDVNTVFEIPSAFKCFGFYFLTYVVSVDDISKAIELIQESGELPNSLKSMRNINHERSKHNKMYWVKIFPKSKDKSSEVNDINIIYNNFELYDVDENPEYEMMLHHLNESDNNLNQYFIQKYPDFLQYKLKTELNVKIKLSYLFEQYLFCKSNMMALSELNKISQDFDHNICLPCLMNITLYAQEVDKNDISSKLKSASVYFKTKEDKRFIFFILNSKRIKTAFNVYQNEFKEISSLVETWVNSKNQGELYDEIYKKSRSFQILFFTQIPIFGSFKSIKVTFQVYLMMKFINNIGNNYSFKKNEELYTVIPFLLHLISLNDYSFIIPLFVLIYQYIITNNVFEELLEENELKYWEYIDKYFSSLSKYSVDDLLAEKIENKYNSLKKLVLNVNYKNDSLASSENIGSSS